MFTSRWEVFVPSTQETYSDRLHVSINRRGMMYLNQTTFRRMGEPDRVKLMYDRQQQTIGIKPVRHDDPAALRFFLKDRGRSTGRMLGASTFCRCFGIKHPGTLVFTNPRFAADGTLTLCMIETKLVTRARIIASAR